MSSPLTVGATAIVAVPANRHRVDVRFQNTGATILYLARAPIVPTALNYEIMLAIPTAGEINEAFISTNSTAQFNVLSSAAAGVLAIYETNRV
jgi:hypothetical protein